jgi:hypothetical protein
MCIDTFMMPSNSRRPRPEFWAPRYVLGRSVRQMIAGLDPDEHDAEITHLSTEVLTPPMMAHIGYANAAARTVAVPHVARTVFREGTGDQIVHPWERDADTLTFFGELIRRGHRSAEGMAACERIQRIHRAVGGIRNEDKIYTLALMASSPRDLAVAMGRPIHSDAESRAQHNFWLGVGRAMRVRDVPETREELQAWTDEYETKHFEPSSEAHEVGEAHIRAIEHWFPGPSKWLARSIFIGSLDARVAECLGYEPTKKPFAMLMQAGWLSFATTTPLLPMRLDSSWVKSFSRVGAKPDLERIGYGTYADTHSADTHSADTHSADTHSADTHSADTHSADTHSADAHSADAHSSDTRSADAHSSDAHSSDAHSSNTHSSDTRSANTRSANTRSSDPRDHSSGNSFRRAHAEKR